MADAHEIWSAAQLAPGEGIEDGVARIEALLALPAPAGEPEMTALPEPDIEDDYGNDGWSAAQVRAYAKAYGDARAEHARRVAMEEAATACEALHDEDRPGDYAYAVRSLAAAPPQGEQT